ncbi:cytochrome c5 family protein [Halieaceae bacterium IMCC14734]|uniref:Cytochrome c5 family protein n=1 Tax=Candidatus Litorirhabdus singularis TaxID=2518993 RepID=A0ABT3TCA6_9GAMM|nr:c-type cytochrome [Candidatus Litorirhabdus singularis]MCX2979928.1 cytochrome c5 family protein [Candidatus Litorirhabdus singularis]
MHKLILGLALSLAFTGAAVADEITAIYDKSCKICHQAGVAGAPKTGDAAQWAPRLEKGMDALVMSVQNGMGVMTAKGMCFDCSADDYKALIKYMAEAK